MMRTKVAATLATLAIPLSVLAADIDGGSLPFPLGTSWVTLFCNIAIGVFDIALAASVIAILVGAFFYLTAGGNEQRVARGKQALTYAVFGIVVVILSWGAAFIVAELLGGANATLTGCS